MSGLHGLFAATGSSRRDLHHAGNLLTWAEAGEGDLDAARHALLEAADAYGRALTALVEAWCSASLAMPPLPIRTDAEAVLAEGAAEDIEDMVDGWIVHGVLPPAPVGHEIDARAALAHSPRPEQKSQN